MHSKLLRFPLHKEQEDMQLEQRPIFIVGSPRSGTTLMRSILDAHPHIFCPAWETGLFVHMDALMNGDLLMVMKDEGSRFPVSRADLVAWVRRVTLDLMDQFGRQSDKTRWAEKTPAHVHHMEFIQEVFPDAQFIHMIRSGYDVVKSLQNMPWAPYGIRWGTRTWISSVQAGRDAGRKMPSGQYLEVRYENLIHDPERIMKEVCVFLGEQFTPQLLAFHEAEKNSWNANRQPLQNTPVNKHPELSLWQRWVFAWSANRLMHDLGYR